MVLRVVGKGSCWFCKLRRGLVGEGGTAEDNGRCWEADMKNYVRKRKENEWAEELIVVQ